MRLRFDLCARHPMAYSLGFSPDQVDRMTLMEAFSWHDELVKRNSRLTNKAES